MTRSEHRSGTERVAEVAVHIGARQEKRFLSMCREMSRWSSPRRLTRCRSNRSPRKAFRSPRSWCPSRSPRDIMDPNIVKVVLDFDGNALYFSRAPIPWVRDREAPVHVQHMKHLGLYAFRRAALLDFPTLPLGDLERIEQLEQLRWMENGYKIRVAETQHDSVSVDVPEDVARVEQLLRKSASAS